VANLTKFGDGMLVLAGGCAMGAVGCIVMFITQKGKASSSQVVELSEISRDQVDPIKHNVQGSLSAPSIQDTEPSPVMSAKPSEGGHVVDTNVPSKSTQRSHHTAVDSSETSHEINPRQLGQGASRGQGGQWARVDPAGKLHQELDSPRGMSPSAKVLHSNVVVVAVTVQRTFQARLLSSSMMTEPRELNAWFRGYVGDIEEGTETIETLEFKIQNGAVMGLVRHTSLYMAKEQGKLIKVPEASKTELMGDFDVRDRPYQFTFQPDVTPFGDAVRGLYFMKVTFKDSTGRMYLQRKVQFRLVQSDRNLNSDGGYPLANPSSTKIKI